MDHLERPKLGPRGIVYDRGQFVLNDESYCYCVIDGKYCGRAKDWAGHGAAHHDFVDSLTLYEVKTTRVVNIGRLHQVQTRWTLISGTVL